MYADYVLTESGGFQIPTSVGARLPVMVDEKGTYSFQRQLVEDHLATYDSKPFVNGALVWALRDFRVRPQWVRSLHAPAPALKVVSRVPSALSRMTRSLAAGSPL